MRYIDAMDQTTTLSIGQRIRHQRQRLQLTQAALAAEFGTSQSAISAVEVGDTQPGLDFLVWFAQRAGTSLEYLVTGREPQSDIEAPSSPADLRQIVAEVLAQVSAGRNGKDGRIGEIGTEYNRERIFLTDRECRLLKALRRLDEPRQERIVAFAEDLAGACDTMIAGRHKKESS